MYVQGCAVYIHIQNFIHLVCPCLLKNICSFTTIASQSSEQVSHNEGKINEFSCVMRKPAFGICKNKGADQLHGIKLCT